MQGKNNYTSNNEMLLVEKEKLESTGLHDFPHILINDNVYSGTLKATDLVSAIC